MMRCEKCGKKLSCTLTIEDPFENNVIVRRKYCYNCKIVYMTTEKVTKIRKRGERDGKVQEKEVTHFE